MTVRRSISIYIVGNEVPIAPPGDPVYEEVYLAMTNRQLSGNEVPIAPAGPVYEEVGLAMIPARTQDIRLESYGQVGNLCNDYLISQMAKRNIKLQPNLE